MILVTDYVLFILYISTTIQLQIAAGEQDKITKLRLVKLLQSFEDSSDSVSTRSKL